MNQDQSKETQLLKQFEHSSNEIQEIDKQNLQIFGFVLAGVAAVMGTAYGKTDPGQSMSGLVLLSLGIVITWIGALFIVSNRMRVWRISTYIRVFIEEELNYIKWETRISRSYDPNVAVSASGPRKKRNPLQKPPETRIVARELLILSIVNLVSTAATADRLWNQPYIPTGRVVGIGVLVLFFGAFVCWAIPQVELLKRSGTIELNYYKYWRALKAEKVPLSATKKEAERIPPHDHNLLTP